MKVLQALTLFMCVLSVLSQDAVPDSPSMAACDCSTQVTAAEKARAEITAKLQSLETSCSESALKAKAEQEEKLKQLEIQLSASCEAETKTKTKAVELQLASALQKVETSLSTAQQQLRDAESKLQDALQKQQGIETKLSSVQQKLQSTESAYAKLAATSSATGADVEKLSSELANTKTKLAEAEAAWVPVRVQKGIVEATEWAKEQYAQAASSEAGQKVLQAVEDAKAAVQDALKNVEPQLQQIKPHLLTAKKTAEDAFNQAKSQAEVLYNQHVKSAAWWKEVQVQWAKIDKELSTVMMTNLRNAPEPFNSYADPVIVQYLVYAVFLLPLSILMYVLSALFFGGKRTSPNAVASSTKTARTSHGGTKTVNVDGDLIATPNKPMKKRR